MNNIVGAGGTWSRAGVVKTNQSRTCTGWVPQAWTGRRCLAPVLSRCPVCATINTEQLEAKHRPALSPTPRLVQIPTHPLHPTHQSCSIDLCWSNGFLRRHENLYRPPCFLQGLLSHQRRVTEEGCRRLVASQIPGSKRRKCAAEHAWKAR
jgi:hypothetical protein